MIKRKVTRAHHNTGHVVTFVDGLGYNSQTTPGCTTTLVELSTSYARTHTRTNTHILSREA